MAMVENADISQGVIGDGYRQQLLVVVHDQTLVYHTDNAIAVEVVVPHADIQGDDVTQEGQTHGLDNMDFDLAILDAAHSHCYCFQIQMT